MDEKIKKSFLRVKEDIDFLKREIKNQDDFVTKRDVNKILADIERKINGLVR